jgi:hypothetical protein
MDLSLVVVVVDVETELIFSDLISEDRLMVAVIIVGKLRATLILGSRCCRVVHLQQKA